MNQYYLTTTVDILHSNQLLWHDMKSAERVSILKRMKRNAQQISFAKWGEETATTNGHDIKSDFGRIQKGFDMLSGASILISLIDELILCLSSDKPLYKQARPSKNERSFPLHIFSIF